MRASNTTPDQVSATAQTQLGSLYEDEGPDGTGLRLWQYVQNGDSVDWTAGMMIGRKDAATTKVGVRLGVSANPERALGAAQRAIPQNYYGYVLVKGDGLVLADATGITVNTGLVPSNATAGALDSAGAVTAVCLGWAHTAIAASVTGRAYINCRG